MGRFNAMMSLQLLRKDLKETLEKIDFVRFELMFPRVHIQTNEDEVGEILLKIKLCGDNDF